MTVKQSAWTGTMPVQADCTRRDRHRRAWRPVVYLNGSYVDQTRWRRVITELAATAAPIRAPQRAPSPLVARTSVVWELGAAEDTYMIAGGYIVTGPAGISRAGIETVLPAGISPPGAFLLLT